MREAELEERHEQYDRVVMRIQFPDGLVLQGCFRPRETGAYCGLGRDSFLGFFMHCLPNCVSLASLWFQLDTAFVLSPV